MGKICLLIKKEAVLFIAFVFALVSMMLIPPDLHYFSYIDYSVLSILFCLMVVAAGLKDLGVFNLMSQRLLARTKSVKFLSIILVNCVFVCSMFMTNDVALIAFVPVSIRIFSSTGHKKLIFIIVMETLAANLGSMLMPIGNPQNLYIYSFYRLSMVSFLQYIIPAGIISYVILTGIILAAQNGVIITSVIPSQTVEPKNIKKPFLYYTVLFMVCIAAVLRFLEGRVFMVSILSSQIISNVPAAMLVSRFTSDVRQLLLGVNIGGLGTPVASLASLISFRIYSRSESSAPGKFLGTFTIYNISLLLLAGVIFALTP